MSSSDAQIEKLQMLGSLRKQAEDILRTRDDKGLDNKSAKISKLLHELQTHQIELELQNEDLRQAQEELLDSQKKYTDLYDFAPVGYLTVSEKGLIAEANLTIVEMLGVERKLLFNQPFSVFIVPQDQDIFYRCRQILIQSETTQTCELRMVKKDGSQFHARLRCSFHPDVDGIEGLFRTVITDISERKKAKEELIRELDFSQSLIVTAQAIILVLNNDGTIKTFNPYMEEISGYKLEEVKGRDWFETFLPNQDWERIRKVFMRAIGAIHTKGNVNSIITKDGRKIFIEWYDKTLKDSEGNIVGLLAVGQDITERNKEEIIKEALIEKLQNALQEIKTLRGIVPICSYCKQIRDDKGFWSQVEEYVTDHTHAEFSHGVCPDCKKKVMKEMELED